MNAPIDTLAFAERFEGAGFGHDQARALAAAFGEARDGTREGLVTKEHLDARLAEVESRITRELAATKIELSREFAATKTELSREFAATKTELIKEMATVGKDVSNRLWSTVTIIAGVATAVSATIAAAVALLLRSGGL